MPADRTDARCGGSWAATDGVITSAGASTTVASIVKSRMPRRRAPDRRVDENSFR
jgi:hypothetical protein